MSTSVELKRFAAQIRMETVKCLIHRGFGHIGGCLSIADVLAALYGKLMHVDPADPHAKERDYLVVSKGHAGPAVFATLALKGYFPLDWMDTLCVGGTRLPSHCDRIQTPGIDVSTGSLGQGLSAAAGLAHGFQIQGMQNNVYCILGDGELQEGQIWEAALYAHQYKLNQLTAFVDWNKKQVDGYVEDMLSLMDIAEKFKAFGWHAQTVDGSDPDGIVQAVDTARREQQDRPAVIVLDGVKGSGIKAVEELSFNHFIDIPEDLAERCMEELTETMSRLEEGMSHD